MIEIFYNYFSHSLDSGGMMMTTTPIINESFELSEIPEASHSCDDVISLQNAEQNIIDEQNLKLGFRRWLILSAYCLLSISNMSTLFAAASISNIAQKFYGKNSLAIDWLAIMCSYVCMVLMFPFSHLVNKRGLSSALVTAGFFNSLGSCIRYIGSFNRQYGYWFFFAGNFCCAVATSAFLFLPSKVAAVWFGSKERAKATSIAIAADSLGMAVGYVQAPLMVPNSNNNDMIARHLSTYLLTVAVQSVLTFVFICLDIKDKPNTPPSASEAAKNTNSLQLENGGALELMKRYIKVLKNCSFHIIFHVNGIFDAAETIWLMILNEILIPRFPGHEVAIGSMGTAGLIASMFSNFLIGTVLDKTKAYRIITLVTTASSFILVGLFLLFFHFTNNFIAFYVIYVCAVAIYTTYYTISFEHGAELTYPVSEADSGAILIWFAQLYDVILAQIASLINHHFQSIWVTYFLLGVYFLAFLLSLAVRNKGPRSHYNLSNIQQEYIT